VITVLTGGAAPFALGVAAVLAVLGCVLEHSGPTIVASVLDVAFIAFPIHRRATPAGLSRPCGVLNDLLAAEELTAYGSRARSRA